MLIWVWRSGPSLRFGLTPSSSNQDQLLNLFQPHSNRKERRKKSPPKPNLRCRGHSDFLCLTLRIYELFMLSNVVLRALIQRYIFYPQFAYSKRFCFFSFALAEEDQAQVSWISSFRCFGPLGSARIAPYQAGISVFFVLGLSPFFWVFFLSSVSIVEFAIMEGVCIGGLSCLPSANKIGKTHITSRLRNRPPYLGSVHGLRNSTKTSFGLSKLVPKAAGESLQHPIGLGFNGVFGGGFSIGVLSKGTVNLFGTPNSIMRHRNLKSLERLSIKAEAAAAASSGAEDLGSVPSSPPRQFLGVEVKTLKKVIPLGLMFFCILYNYTILRDTKDVLVVTAKGSSAEIIPFLKTWVNLPMAIGFMIIYTKLSNVLSKEALFYSCILPFIAFFGAFAFILYPLVDVLHPIGLADKLLEMLGPRFLGPLAILRIWTFCLFYVMAELWGSVVVSVLFWGFANQITTVDEAKQFYPLFGLGANVALVFSGRTVKYFSHMRKNLGPGVDGWAVSLKGMMSLVVLLGLVITGIYWWTNKYVVNDPTLPKAEARKKKEKPKLGMVESAKFLLKSRYVRDLATLVVAYGISINLVEVTWKSKLKEQFPSPNEYSAFMGDFSSCTGIATFSMMLLSRYIFRKYGWGVAATITPTVLLVTGVAFFSLVLGSDALSPLLVKFGTTPLLAAVYVGAMQNIFSKSAKYSLFDPCKEMAYIPLDEDTKVKGKAAIDVVCNPLGKSGGALIQQFLILACGSLANSTPYLGVILLVIVLAWLNAARSLDEQFTPLVKKDLKSKLLEGKLSTMSKALSANIKKKPEVTYRFVSMLNEQGFIEGRYVPVTEGNTPLPQSDGNLVMPENPPTDKLEVETTTSTPDGAAVVPPTESSDDVELHSSEPAPAN